jgi:TonB family protein
MLLKAIWCCSPLCIGLLHSSAAVAQCPPAVPIAELLSRSSTEVVFGGVVANIDRTDLAETVTFSVDWVWKGSVRTSTSIVRPVRMADGSGLEPISFELKNRYVVAAHRLTDEERQNLRLSSAEEQLGVDLCGSGSRLLSVAQSDLARMGPGHAPQDRAAGRPQTFPPVKIKDAALEIPPGLTDVHGTVVLEIMIDASGHVLDPKVLRSIANLDQVAIDCVTKWEYAPALLNGVPVPVHMTVTIPFGGAPRSSPIK